MTPAPFGTLEGGGSIVLLKRLASATADEGAPGVHASAHYQRRLRKVVDELTSRTLVQAKAGPLLRGQ